MRPSDREADAYIERKLGQLPRCVGAPIRKLRRDRRLWLRMTIGLLLMLGGFLWFLPVLGIWMLPLGIVVLASEFPVLKRRLVGAAMRIERCFGRSRTPRA